MFKKVPWLVFKTLEFVLTWACCLSLVWYCYEIENHSHITLLVGFYGISSIISLGSLITLCLMKTPIIKNEAEHAFIMSMLHLTGIYIHLNVAIMEMCSLAIYLALCATAAYLVHCNMALAEMFFEGGYLNQHLIMPPFYFKRTGGPQVYLCEPMPSLNGPTGLPPIYYEEI